MHLKKKLFSYWVKMFSSMPPLHLKIIAGYLLIVGLLAIIVFVMHYENGKLSLIQANEKYRNASRGIIYQIDGKLLDITIPGELLPLWDKTDFKQYHDDTQSTIVLLNELKAYYPDVPQCSRIDSVRFLLKEKEIQIGKLHELLSINNKTIVEDAFTEYIDKGSNGIMSVRNEKFYFKMSADEGSIIQQGMKRWEFKEDSVKITQ